MSIKSTKRSAKSMREPLKNRLQSIIDSNELKNQWAQTLEKQVAQTGKETAYSSAITKKTICLWDSINYETD